ncbi:hypothetical protein [Acutalibacter sp. 1XD8-36]|uniref:hypothetical protein n=1 Tax=Acutalibacter sp. 1XD8-36 TaxID=2320852 RepID=UPI0014131A02|nr:hypothetical protein [Acutalibacter sp. 1XD8-36]NBJ90891.1 hypothetical protein [Acutalibacter sp. 1XD8-36]
MRKGKFGIVLCFYPIAAFAAVILNSPLICAALTAVAVFLEKDDWTGRQTVQAWMASAVVYFVSHMAAWLDMIYIPYISGFLSLVSSVIFVLIYIAAIIFSVLSIIRVRKDEEANFPLLSELAYRIYGQRKPKPVVPPMQYPSPYSMPQMPQQPSPAAAQAPQQPYPPQGAYPASPAPAPQYTPPMAVQPSYEAQQPLQQPQEPGQDSSNS